MFAIATHASGETQARDGEDLLSVVDAGGMGREHYLGVYGEPGTSTFKCMIRWREWKYIYLANGGLEQVFNLSNDPCEIEDHSKTNPQVVDHLRKLAIADLLSKSGTEAAIESNDLLIFSPSSRPFERIHQFDRSRGISKFPENPGDCL